MVYGTMKTIRRNEIPVYTLANYIHLRIHWRFGLVRAWPEAWASAAEGTKKMTWRRRVGCRRWWKSVEFRLVCRNNVFVLNWKDKLCHVRSVLSNTRSCNVIGGLKTLALLIVEKKNVPNQTLRWTFFPSLLLNQHTHT